MNFDVFCKKYNVYGSERNDLILRLAAFRAEQTIKILKYTLASRHQEANKRG